MYIIYFRITNKNFMLYYFDGKMYVVITMYNINLTSVYEKRRIYSIKKYVSDFEIFLTFPLIGISLKHSDVSLRTPSNSIHNNFFFIFVFFSFFSSTYFTQSKSVHI